MQITMFKGLLPVNLPDTWFSKPNNIQFAKVKDSQAINFRSSGGTKALRFWVEHHGTVTQHWAELTPEELEQADWGDVPYALESRATVKMFGQSGTVLDLKSVLETEE